METPQYLILGGNGLVGKSLRKRLDALSLSYAATSRDATAFENAIACDVTDTAALKTLIYTVKPQVVINATNLAGGVDFCEHNPDKAAAFHLQVNQVLADVCKEINAKLVFISTDYVFDGTKTQYAENELTNPLNKYGYFKLKAEEYITGNLEDNLIIRTTNVYGWDPDTKTPNFLMGLYFKLTNNEMARVPSYLSGTPTYADDLANVIVDLCEKKAHGLFHVVGPELIDRYQWALAFCKEMNLPVSLVEEVNTAPENMIPRPLRAQLISEKLGLYSNACLNNVENGLKLMHQQL